MKITIIGAAGVRTPLILEAMARRQEQLGLDELALMDIDARRLELVGALTAVQENSGRLGFKVTRTTRSMEALEGADFVITTFRVGGIQSRVIDERVPIDCGVLGQETTGPGGFAMGLRSIPVLLDYLRQMKDICPEAWLLNFANPSGMLTEAAIKAGYERAVGICDAPAGMGRAAASAISGIIHREVPPEQVYLDYFGLNHLGWLRRIVFAGQDYQPHLIAMLQAMGGYPGLPFEPEFIAQLGLIPNEYLYYYYYAKQAVDNQQAGQTRGEQLAELNQRLFAELERLMTKGSRAEMLDCYRSYLGEREQTYMVQETGGSERVGFRHPQPVHAAGGEGYAGVALDLVAALSGAGPRQMVLNMPNNGAIHGMGPTDVVEAPALVSHGAIRPLSVGAVPDHALGLMMQVKEFERLTIAASLESSYDKATLALTIHPLVSDRALAKRILDGYIERHGSYFPSLKRTRIKTPESEHGLYES